MRWRRHGKKLDSSQMQILTASSGAYVHAFVPHLDLSRAPYVLYGVKYIDLVSLGAFAPSISYSLTSGAYVHAYATRYFPCPDHISVYIG